MEIISMVIFTAHSTLGHARNIIEKIWIKYLCKHIDIQAAMNQGLAPNNRGTIS
jgi:hypothetical protein